MKGAPNGFFADGLMLFGSPEKGGLAAKGYVLQPPDLRGGSVACLNGYQDKIRGLLATLSIKMRAQLQWTCHCDYKKELTRYFRETERVAHPHLKRVRTERFQRYWEKMHRRELRREDLVLFLSTEIYNLKARGGLEAYYEKLLGQLGGQFEELTGTLRTIFGSDTTVAPMGDAEHFIYFKKFLNPSLA
ncbi:MAG: hypothetical protein KGJ37_02430, partial [Verrucomicrobiota bacterium]|nr:hypothetical protein [Verrucomicrobiota bacterium]